MLLIGKFCPHQRTAILCADNKERSDHSEVTCPFFAAGKMGRTRSRPPRHVREANDEGPRAPVLYTHRNFNHLQNIRVC